MSLVYQELRSGSIRIIPVTGGPFPLWTPRLRSSHWNLFLWGSTVDGGFNMFTPLVPLQANEGDGEIPLVLLSDFSNKMIGGEVKIRCSKGN